MASVKNSIVTRKFKGLLGDEVVFRQWEGKTVVAKAPEAREGDPTPAQAQLQERFLLASRYAKSVIKNADKSLAEAYAEALKPRQNVYSRALADFMSLPEIKVIDVRQYKGAVGGKIITRALDDFRVKSVRVEVYAANGTLLEEGDAVQNDNGLDWTCTATQANNLLTGSKIKATATDVPGNEGMLEVTL